jgi:hypothetical protein
MPRITVHLFAHLIHPIFRFSFSATFTALAPYAGAKQRHVYFTLFGRTLTCPEADLLYIATGGEGHFEALIYSIPEGSDG